MLQRFSQSSKKAVAVTSCAALLLTGCVTTQEQRIGADDGTDACRPYVVALDATGDYFAAEMVQGALIGAVAGGLIGALTAGGNDVGSKALIGAAAGAALGAGGGYITAKMQQEQDKAVLYQSVLSDYEREVAKIDEAQFAFDKLVDCRNGAFRQVKIAYATKQISREEARRRWDLLLRQQANDVQVAELMGKRMAERMAEFDSANASLATVEWQGAERQKMLQQSKKSYEIGRKDLAQKHQQEVAKLAAEIEAEKKAAAGSKAEVARRKKELDASKAKLAKELKEKQLAERQQLDRQKEMALAVPTTTGQVKIQKYQETVKAVAAAQQSGGPDGFETSGLWDRGLRYVLLPVLSVSVG